MFEMGLVHMVYCSIDFLLTPALVSDNIEKQSTELHMGVKWWMLSNPFTPFTFYPSLLANQIVESGLFC